MQTMIRVFSSMTNCAVVLALLVLAGCQSTSPVDRPCGVIIDSLRDVKGATPADTRRVDVHFERGVAAGCWKRQ
jgi:hypothetical protein